MVDVFEEYDCRPKSYTHDLSGQTIGNYKVLPGRSHVEKAALLVPDLYYCFLEGDAGKDQVCPGPGVLRTAHLHSSLGAFIQRPPYWWPWLRQSSPL